MFWTRLLSGAVLVALLLGVFMLGDVWLAVFLCFLALAGFYEMAKALNTGNSRFNALTVSGYVFVVCYYAALYFNNNAIMVMVPVIGFVILLAVYVICFPKFTVEDVMGTVFSYVYAPVMLGFIYLTRNLPDGKLLVWLIIIAAWGYDTMAYCVGMITGKTIGNHKAFPVLSPKKSIEGIFGGVIGAGLIGFIFAHFFMPSHELMIVIIASLGGIIAQVGDLAASAVKRNKEIKDYSHLIPGHGGVLDRFDSVIFTAPIIYFLCSLLLKSL